MQDYSILASDMQDDRKIAERFILNFEAEQKKYEVAKRDYNAQRGSQSNGAVIADVIGLPGIHQEVKFVERLNLRAAMVQSEGDAKDGEIPIVAHKCNRKPWLVTMNSEDFFKLYKAWREQQ